jgi:AraC family transcriptional regulator
VTKEHTRMKSDVRSQSAYGEQMAKYFRLSKAPSLVISPPGKPPIAITRLTSNTGLPEQTEPIPPEKAFVISMHLTPATSSGCEIWTDDKHSRVTQWPAGGVGAYNLESSLRKRHGGPLDWVHYHVPHSALDAFADENGKARIKTLRCSHGKLDPVLHQMTQLILLSLDHPGEQCELFLDYFCLLFSAHLFKTYAPSVSVESRFRGGLAPWQKRRASELIGEHLDGGLRLATLAAECGLSVSHFARSFRRSFGTSAHRYLILRRLEVAKALLSAPDLPLSEIALRSGFSDQAAFSRAFGSFIGTPPGQWRREFACRRSRSQPLDRNVSSGLHAA